jgi:hypothetical protein
MYLKLEILHSTKIHTSSVQKYKMFGFSRSKFSTLRNFRTFPFCPSVTLAPPLTRSQPTPAAMPSPPSPSRRRPLSYRASPPLRSPERTSPHPFFHARRCHFHALEQISCIVVELKIRLFPFLRQPDLPRWCSICRAKVRVEVQSWSSWCSADLQS